MKNIRDVLSGMDKKKRIYLLLAMAAGLCLAFFGSIKELDTSKDTAKPASISTTEQTAENENAYERYMEERLKQVLSNVSGVGRVDVFITYKAGFESVLAEDEQRDFEETKETAADGGERTLKREKTDSKKVFAKQGANDSPLIVKEFKPEVMGVLIVAEGGDNEAVSKSLTNAAMILLNVEAYKVSVLKMK